jgi:hypothetical protein
MRKVIQDGFIYNLRSLDLPNRYYPLALDAMEFLRRNPAAWRPRWFSAPLDFVNTSIPARDQWIQQIRIFPGSYLIGYNFTAVSGALTDFLVQVKFDYDNSTLFSSPIYASALRATGASGHKMILLPQPKLMDGSLLTVTISNVAAAARQCQFVLHLAEPWSSREERGKQQ